jgi:hypothetical protein
MKKLSKTAFAEIRNWIYRNARPLDLALWQYTFENGSKENFISTLKHYQNEDGGFGKSIDPDNWNPASSPYNTQFAVKLLRDIHFTDITHPVYKGILHYLENSEYKSEYGWFFTIPSNNEYPRGVWWTFDEEENKYQGVGTTAELCGFILRYCDESSALYKIAFEFTKMLIERLKSETNHGDMGVQGYYTLARDIKESSLTSVFDFTFLSERVSALIDEKIKNEKDNFMANPLEFIPSPQDGAYENHKDDIEKALDHIANSRHENGVWDIPWEWYNEFTATKNFAITENWWKASIAIHNFSILKNWNRLED